MRLASAAGVPSRRPGFAHRLHAYRWWMRGAWLLLGLSWFPVWIRPLAQRGSAEPIEIPPGTLIGTQIHGALFLVVHVLLTCQMWFRPGQSTTLWLRVKQVAFSLMLICVGFALFGMARILARFAL